MTKLKAGSAAAAICHLLIDSQLTGGGGGVGGRPQEGEGVEKCKGMNNGMSAACVFPALAELLSLCGI